MGAPSWPHLLEPAARAGAGCRGSAAVVAGREGGGRGDHGGDRGHGELAELGHGLPLLSYGVSQGFLLVRVNPRFTGSLSPSACTPTCRVRKATWGSA